ncbi:hypothetical protein [Paludisphaera mucosa]|uniref:Uncharacterized protein n=1 Tax=Paludisphaera mucosa TaxID=3030827 RepID=A0ABT6FKF5_9BACT|nr:hypothetical protein [Paludisphaera mucosa]MDG3008044.1 hypothetical protein [Paludisphaera mucosa]
MSIGLKKRTKKAAKAGAPKSSSRKLAETLVETSRTQAQEPPRDVESAVAHVVGKPAEVEPREYAAQPAEEPEAAMQSDEAPDAGYGRCTESSDWENRGRS